MVTSLSLFLPPSLPEAVLVKSFSIRESTWEDWEGCCVGPLSGGEAHSVRLCDLAPLSPVGGRVGSVQVLNQNRHHGTPTEGLSISVVSPSDGSLPTIWHLLLETSGGRALDVAGGRDADWPVLELCLCGRHRWWDSSPLSHPQNLSPVLHTLRRCRIA